MTFGARPERSRSPTSASARRSTMNDDTTLSLVLFSGTDDRLAAAAVLATGAAAMGRPVNVFLQYWALDAFRKTKIADDHGSATEAGPSGTTLVRQSLTGQRHWSELLKQAKDIGEVKIHACALSMELFGLTKGDRDAPVDDVEGPAPLVIDGSRVPIP